MNDDAQTGEVNEFRWSVVVACATPPSIDETTHNSASPLLRRCLGRVAGAKRQPATARLRRGCMSASVLLSFRARIVICGTDPEFGCTFGHCLGRR